MSCALVSPEGLVELLDLARVDVSDVLQGPVHCLGVREFTLFYSTAAYHLSQVNPLSAVANQLIKGDVLVQSKQQQLLDCLLQSKHLRLAASDASTSSKGGLDPAAVLAAKRDESACSERSSSSSQECGAVLSKPRSSVQHIAAANSTRQRILRSMSAASAPPSWQPAAAPSGCDTATPPQLPQRAAPSSQGGGGTGSGSATTPTAGSGSLPPSHCSGRMLAGSSSSSIPFVNVVDSNSSGAGSDSSSSSSGSGGQALARHLQQPCRRTRSDSCIASPAPTAQPMDLDCRELPSVVSAGACSQARGANAPGSTAACCAPPHTAPQHGSRANCTRAQPHSSSTGRAKECSGSSTHAAAAAADGVATAAAAAAALCTAPAWDDLPVEVIACMARFCGATVASVMPVCMTCSAWRRAVLEDDQLLLALSFRLTGPAPRAASRCRPSRAGLQFPALLDRATRLGNVSALVVSARLLDAAGAPEEALRCWRRAAKAGQLEGQLVYGLALYRGTAGVGQDAEDAHLWLSKALKQVLAAKPPATSSSNDGGGGDGTCAAACTSAAPAAPSGGSCCSPRAPVPAEREEAALHGRVLSQAGLVLGYLSFDGEGMRTDKQEAVRFFKLAAQAGSKEAEQVLGWIFNTGQY